MGNTVFNFAMGPYPKESRIAHATIKAVTSLRKWHNKAKAIPH
jgi:hypothetical protein